MACLENLVLSFLTQLDDATQIPQVSASVKDEIDPEERNDVEVGRRIEIRIADRRKVNREGCVYPTRIYAYSPDDDVSQRLLGTRTLVYPRSAGNQVGAKPLGLEASQMYHFHSKRSYSPTFSGPRSIPLRPP